MPAGSSAKKSYDFTKPVTGDITLAAKWLKEGENAVSITPQKVYVTTGDIEGKLYIAAYKDGRLTAIKALDSKPGFARELSKLGPYVSAADKLAAFLWDCVIIRQETKKPNNSKGLRAVRNSLIRF